MGIKADSRTRLILIEVENMENATRRELRRGWHMICRILKSTASKNILHKPRFGRVYRIRGRRHVASVPGESWANLSGRSRRGLFCRVQSWRRLSFGNTEKVAKFMEFGTKTIAPRPAHLISIRQNNRNMINILESHIGKGIGA